MFQSSCSRGSDVTEKKTGEGIPPKPGPSAPVSREEFDPLLVLRPTQKP